MAKKNLTSEFLLFQVRRLETLVPKNHFVREVAPFPRSGHIFLIIKFQGLVARQPYLCKKNSLYNVLLGYIWFNVI